MKLTWVFLHNFNCQYMLVKQVIRCDPRQSRTYRIRCDLGIGPTNIIDRRTWLRHVATSTPLFITLLFHFVGFLFRCNDNIITFSGARTSGNGEGEAGWVFAFIPAAEDKGFEGDNLNAGTYCGGAAPIGLCDGSCGRCWSIRIADGPRGLLLRALRI